MFSGFSSGSLGVLCCKEWASFAGVDGIEGGVEKLDACVNGVTAFLHICFTSPRRLDEGVRIPVHSPLLRNFFL